MFAFVLSGCDFIDGLLGKSDGNDSPAGNDEPALWLATGGDNVTTIPVEGEGNSSLVWEIHVFTTPVEHTLEFPSSFEGGSVKADYLIVAGGGGSAVSASSGDYAGGGGAGGLLYKTGVNLPLENKIVRITVGAGGAGVSQKEKPGANGGDSAVGDIVVPGGGGGGGGAGGPGQDASTTAAGAGGLPWTAASNDASWIVGIINTAEFSRGGNGGDPNSADIGVDGAYYGDGGSAGKATQGGSGHDGIVVIRFQRPVVQ
jgi:hypothetical protein